MMKRGFTLIELSIVLVIVALLVAGIVVGKELVQQSVLRAQMNQISQYQTAVSTFKLKYGGLPGDLQRARALSVGFITRTGEQGRGDGNGLLQDQGKAIGTWTCTNEMAMFWRDLSDSTLIAEPSTGTDGWCSDYRTVFPKSKLRENYIAAWGGGPSGIVVPPPSNGKNYVVLSLHTVSVPYDYTTPGLFPLEARDIDVKLDDGMPQNGKIQAFAPYHDYGVWVSAVSGGAWGGGAAPGVATPANTYYCYDNGNVATNQMQYTISTGSDILKCSLSFELP